MGEPVVDGKGDAQIIVKAGAARFGGVMRMLGALTTKVCYFRIGGCSLGGADWRYDAIGASAYFDNTTGSYGLPTANAVISQGYLATYKAYYYHTALMQQSTVQVEGARFPWTTGSVTLKATGRGPHKTVHYARGFDNRNTTTTTTPTTTTIPNTHMVGTIQLVTPVLTRWLLPCCQFETGGIGILRIKFVGAAPDSDADGVANVIDNCSEVANSDQDDTDGDDCGNLCDTDYDQNGVAGWSDFGFFQQCFGTTSELCQHHQPIGPFAGFVDFGAFLTDFGKTPGPSGTTAGTTACP